MQAVSGKSSLIYAGVLALSLVPTTLSLALQANTSPATTRYEVNVVRVKPDMVAEWVDLQKNEVIPAQKKGGVKERTVWNTAVGNAFEYTIVTPYPSLAALDGPSAQARALGPEAAVRLGAKLRKCVDTQRTFLANRIDDLTIPQGNAIASRVVLRRAADGKTQEFFAVIRTDVMAAFKKAKASGKIAGFSVATRGIGAPAGELTITTYFNKFADMDEFGFGQILGPDAANKATPKLDALGVCRNENFLYAESITYGQTPVADGL